MKTRSDKVENFKWVDDSGLDQTVEVEAEVDGQGPYYSLYLSVEGERTDYLCLSPEDLLEVTSGINSYVESHLSLRIKARIKALEETLRNSLAVLHQVEAEHAGYIERGDWIKDKNFVFNQARDALEDF